MLARVHIRWCILVKFPTRVNLIIQVLILILTLVVVFNFSIVIVKIIIIIMRVRVLFMLSVVGGIEISASIPLLIHSTLKEIILVVEGGRRSGAKITCIIFFFKAVTGQRIRLISRFISILVLRRFFILILICIVFIRICILIPIRFLFLLVIHAAKQLIFQRRKFSFIHIGFLLNLVQPVMRIDSIVIIVVVGIVSQFNLRSNLVIIQTHIRLCIRRKHIQ
mmetsp:Transcript_20073/g.32002  ORF Transcript_20073/g.32002 Transcript_20073/m.32002 type:complete len:222 (+) Transcript_20073:576-1241(+)